MKYREINKITGLRGTAVNVQTMVYGNINDNSGTGAFARVHRICARGSGDCFGGEEGQFFLGGEDSNLCFVGSNRSNVLARPQSRS